MTLTIAGVIDPAEHAALLSLAGTATFVDGRVTAGAHLAELKHNEQVAPESPLLGEVARIVGPALQRNASFCGATIPRHLHSLRIARYGVGMRYGAHVDSALMTDGGRVLRSDLSFTIFLDEPDAYDGGELCLDTGGGEMRFKLPARAAVCYATGQLHQVRAVTRGERRVVVGWIQSCVRDPAQREVLWDLSQTMELVHAAEGKSRAWELVVKTHNNLLRGWAEP